MLIDASQIHIRGSSLPANPAHRQITSHTAGEVLRDMDAAVIHPPGFRPRRGRHGGERSPAIPQPLFKLGIKPRLSLHSGVMQDRLNFSANLIRPQREDGSLRPLTLP